MLMNVRSAAELMTAALTAAGYSDDEATVIADHLLDCELRGVSYL